jgi:chromosome partitioning protein
MASVGLERTRNLKEHTHMTQEASWPLASGALARALGKRARRISVVNQKGGVGKSTVAVNLAVALATRGRRVLLLDYDPQANASMFLGLTDKVEEEGTYGTAEFTFGRGSFAPMAVSVPGLHVVPATQELSFADYELAAEGIEGGRRLATAVRAVEGVYDVIIADCPPTLAMLATNAIVACPEVLIPVRLAAVSMAGAKRLLSHLQRLQERQEPSIRVLGFVGTFYTDSANKPRETLDALRRAYGDAVFRTTIHRAQAVEDAGDEGLPVVRLAPKARGAEEFERLGEEVWSRG